MDASIAQTIADLGQMRCMGSPPIKNIEAFSIKTGPCLAVFKRLMSSNLMSMIPTVF